MMKINNNNNHSSDNSDNNNNTNKVIMNVENMTEKESDKILS